MEDKTVHKLIDSLEPDLRHSANREFYDMDCERAYEILSAVAQISGNDDCLVKNPLDDDYFGETAFKASDKDSIKTVKPFSSPERKPVPDGTYYFAKTKKSDEKKQVTVTADVKDGIWTFRKNAVIGIKEDKGASDAAKEMRKKMRLNNKGVLLEDFCLGNCTPSFAGNVAMNQSINGWDDWKDKNGRTLDEICRL